MKILFFLLVCLNLIFSSFSSDNRGFYYLGTEDIFSYDVLISSPKTVIVAWTARCPLCYEEFKTVCRYVDSYPDVKFLFVNIGESEGVIDRFLNKPLVGSCVKENTVLDRRGIIIDSMGIMGVPTFVIFKDQEAVTKTHRLNNRILDYVFGE